ncbi:MAG: hypothetical protein NPINA01_32700 [Nitrospinaceae bacterium]|nr:MAG: hypothetical protein NPINA01_32700 [Nitrospinaceae bacterium]
MIYSWYRSMEMSTVVGFPLVFHQWDMIKSNLQIKIVMKWFCGYTDRLFVLEVLWPGRQVLKPAAICLFSLFVVEVKKQVPETGRGQI